MAITLSAHQTRLLRLKSQRLLLSPDEEPASTAGVLRQIVGVQAQEMSAASLSIRARSAGLTAAQVRQSRTDERSIAWIWCLRGTLHLVAAEDARWLVPLLGPAFIAGDRRRMRQLGWDEASAAAGITLLQAALAERGGLTRHEITRLLETNGLPHEGQAPFHLLFRSALEGKVCPGSDRGKETTYVLFDDWLGKPQPLPHQDALAKLSLRYLETYAPAGPQDLASWSGLALGEVRKAWELIADQVIQVEAAGGVAWMLKSHLSWLDKPSDPTPCVRLLPRFDTYLLGYASRDLALDPVYARRVHPGGGIIHPVLLVDGRVLGTWKIQRRSARREIRLEPFERLAGELLPLIEAEVEDVGRFLNEHVSCAIISPMIQSAARKKAAGA